MKKIYLLGLALVISLSAFFTVSAVKEYSTVQSCTDLLPQGYNFSLNIEAEIDTNGSSNALTGELNMTDGTTKRNPELSKKIEPFKQCVLKLIK